MAFSVSFVYKATDKYSTVLNKMAKATRKYADAMKRIQTESKKTSTSMGAMAKKLDSAGSKFTASSGKINVFTRNMRGATKATNSQITALNKLNRIRVKPVNFGGGLPSGMGGRGRGGRRGMGGLGGALGDASAQLGIMGAGLLAPGAYSLKKAMDYEKQFASVKKVINDTIDNPAVMKQMYDNMVKMSGKLPISQSDIFDIAQVAGAAGIGDNTRKVKGIQAARKEIEGFVELMGQTSVAFDMGGKEVTEFSMALVRQFDFKDPVKEMRVLNDQINQLENKMGSDAYGILNNMRRIGGITKMLGLSAPQTAAMSSMLLDMGVPERMVDTTIKDFMKTFIDPKGLPDKNYAALAGVWSGGKKFKTGAEVDATVSDFHKQTRAKPLETMIALLQKAKKLGPETLTAVSRIWGPEYSAFIGLMASRLDRMQYALDLVGDKAGYSGSMLREMDQKVKTLSGQLGRFKNIIDAIAASIGTGMDHALTGLLTNINDSLEYVRDWITVNPDIAAGFVMLAGALGVVFLAFAAIGGIGIFLTPIVALLIELGTFMGITGGSIAILIGLFQVGAAFIAAWIWPVTAVIAVLVGLGAAFMELYNRWEPFKNFVDSYFTMLREGALMIGSTLNVALQGTLKILGDLYNKMVEIGGIMANSPIGQWVGGLLNDQAARWQTDAMKFKRYRETEQWGDSAGALAYPAQQPAFPHSAPQTPSPFGNMDMALSITMQDNRTMVTATSPDGSKKSASVPNTGKNMKAKV